MHGLRRADDDGRIGAVMKFEDKQLAILQCPQCDGWFVDTADRDGEACPVCFEGYNPPPMKQKGDIACAA